MHLAAERGHTSTVEFLADKFKASVFDRTKDGSTLMHIAALNGHPDTAMVLFKKGVPLLMPNKVSSLWAVVLNYCVVEFLSASLLHKREFMSSNPRRVKISATDYFRENYHSIRSMNFYSQLLMHGQENLSKYCNPAIGSADEMEK
jgi:hypothetical protein